MKNKLSLILIICMIYLVPARLSADTQEQAIGQSENLRNVFLSIDQENSWLTFFLKGNVHDTLGSPEKIEGSVTAHFSQNGDLLKAEGGIKVSAAALDTKDKARDKRMKKKFLHVKKYPDIAFNLTSFSTDTTINIKKVSGADISLPVTLNGELLIHGVKRNISIECSILLNKGQLIIDGATRLLLQDFNIKNPSLLFFRTSNDVDIKFHIILTGIEFD